MKKPKHPDIKYLIENGLDGVDHGYHIMGSFIYWNCYVLDRKKSFGKFMFSLVWMDQISEIEEKYQSRMNLSLSDAENQWKEWLKNLKPDSQVSVPWN